MGILSYQKIRIKCDKLKLFSGYFPVITEVNSQNETSKESHKSLNHKSLNRRPFSSEFPFKNMHISPLQFRERPEGSYLPHFNKMASKQLKSFKKSSKSKTKSETKNKKSSKNKTKSETKNKTKTKKSNSNSMFKSFFKSMFKSN